MLASEASLGKVSSHPSLPQVQDHHCKSYLLAGPTLAIALQDKHMTWNTDHVSIKKNNSHKTHLSNCTHYFPASPPIPGVEVTDPKWHGNSECPCHLRGFGRGEPPPPRHSAPICLTPPGGMGTLSAHAIWGLWTEPLELEGWLFNKP